MTGSKPVALPLGYTPTDRDYFRFCCRYLQIRMDYLVQRDLRERNFTDGWGACQFLGGEQIAKQCFYMGELWVNFRPVVAAPFGQC